MIREPFIFEKVDFQVFGRSTVREIDPGVPHLLISITNPDAPEAELVDSSTRLGVLRLSFWDTDDPNATINAGMSSEQARQIVALVQEYAGEFERIVCQCEAGVSRSAGVAAGLSQWLNGTADPFYAYFTPNWGCYQKVLDATEGQE